jgi:hypothetical protein
MQIIRDFVGYELEWVKANWLRNEYILRADENTVLAQMRMRGSAGAEVAVAGGVFSIQRKGFWKPKLLVTQGDPALLIATLSRIGNGGALDFEDGQTQQYVWKKARALSSEYLWEDSAGRPVLHAYPSSWKDRVRLAFEPLASQSARVEVLTLLAGFLTIIAYENAANAAATTTTIIASN